MHLLPILARRLYPLCIVCLVLCPATLATEAAKKSFTIPAGDAAETLKVFSEQSGEQIVFMVDNVRGEVTAPLSGQFTHRAALDRMLAGTALVAAEDKATGALTVGRREP